MERTIESYSHLRAEHQPKRDGESKIHIYLGGGKGIKLLLTICLVFCCDPLFGRKDIVIHKNIPQLYCAFRCKLWHLALDS